MSFWFFMGAGTLSAIWLVVHLTAGGRDIARPILHSTDLAEVVRETQYLCWHFTSVSIACMAGFFISAAAADDHSLAIAGVALAGGFSISGIGLVALRKGNHFRLPQGWLFVPVVSLGLAGLFS